MTDLRQTSEPKINSYKLRIFLLLSFVSLFIFLVVVRLFNLQVLNHDYYQELASNQQGSSSAILPKRGDIYLTPINQNDPLLVATSINKNSVYAIPKQISNKDETASRLAKLLQYKTSDLLAKISSSGSYILLRKDVDNEISAQIKSLKLTGIYLEGQDNRFYPEGNLASQVIGFLGFSAKGGSASGGKATDRVGQYGVEGKFEEKLAGQSGILGETSGWLKFAQNLNPATDGDDIYLTLDPSIQFKAQQVLADSVTKHGADRGSVVIVNPKSGKILAMATYPDFDLNNYGKVEDPTVFSNQVLSADYEPGSIFKPITMAASINEGKVTPDTKYENTGSVQVDDKLIKNSDPTVFLGQQNMIAVLDESLNTGAYFAEQQIGNDIFKKYVQNFGFGKIVSKELPAQTPGNLDNLNKKGNVFFATASFGQGITVTPLQMIQAYSAIANEGKMIQPYFVDKMVHPDGEEELTEAPNPVEVIDPKTANTVSAMLVDVVENGHGKRAAVAGYFIAGKTGTAQVAYKDRSGYDPNTNIGSFVGFGPVDKPQFVMLVRIDNPKDVKFAESTAAPAFGEIAQFILNYLQVAPSRQQ